MAKERTLSIPADYFSSEESRAYVSRQWRRLCGELDAAEQHVKILRERPSARESSTKPGELRFTWDRDEGALHIVSPGTGTPIRRAPELYEAELIEEIERLQQLIRVADDVGNVAAAEIRRVRSEQVAGDEPKATQCTGCFMGWPMDADGWHSVPDAKHHRFKCIAENRQAKPE